MSLSALSLKICVFETLPMENPEFFLNADILIDFIDYGLISDIYPKRLLLASHLIKRLPPRVTLAVLWCAPTRRVPSIWWASFLSAPDSAEINPEFSPKSPHFQTGSGSKVVKLILNRLLYDSPESEGACKCYMLSLFASLSSDGQTDAREFLRQGYLRPTASCDRNG